MSYLYDPDGWRVAKLQTGAIAKQRVAEFVPFKLCGL